MTLILMAGLLSAHADEYAYLTFMTTDRIKASVKVSSLQLTISGTLSPYTSSNSGGGNRPR